MISAWLNQRIRVASESSRDGYGKPIYGTPREISARVERSSRLVRNARGEEVTSSARVYLLEAIGFSDRVWLDGDDFTSIDASRLPIAITTSIDKSATRALYRVDV